MAEVQLVKEGWHLSANGYQQCSENGQKDVPNIIKTALNFDLKEVGEKSLPEGVSRGKIDSVSGPCVLQIQKIRNVSAPKEDDESRAAPHLLKVTLTDGQSSCNGLVLENIDKLSLKTLPGCKLKLIGLVPVKHGFLLLNSLCVKILGGNVEKMVQSWELKKSLASVAKNARAGGENGAPPFIPFGQRDRSQPVLNKRDNFRSLDVKKDVVKKEENEDFAAQRQATIAEAQQAKLDTKSKTFGGGYLKKPADRDVAKIVEMGFTAEDASNSLRHTSDVQEAINSLLSLSVSGNNSNTRNYKTLPSSMKISQKSERPPRKGRRGRGGDDDDIEDFGAPPSRPSGPATLFDFLETKITTSNKEEGKSTSSSENRQYSSQGNKDSSSSFQSDYRRTQNLPPRLQNKRAENQARLSKQGPPPGVGKSRQNDDRSYNQGSDRYSRNNRSDHYGKQDQSDYHGNRNDRYGNNNRYNRNDRYNNDDRYSDYDSNNRFNSSEYGHRSDGTNQSSRHQSNRQQSARSFDDRSDHYNTVVQERPYSNSSGSDQSHLVYNPTNSYKEESYTPSYTENYFNPQLQVQPAISQYNEYDPHNQTYTMYTKPVDFQYSDYVTVDATVANNGHGDIQQYIPDYNGAEPQVTIYTNLPDGDNDQAGYEEYDQERPTRKWKVGDYCLAKYWEDGKLYRANVISINDNGKSSTCIVSFTDYGNTEEVAISDIRTVSKHAWTDSSVQTTILHAPTSSLPFPPHILTIPPPNFSIPPPPYVAQHGFTVEYRRGGQGPIFVNGRKAMTPTLYQPAVSTSQQS